MTTLSKYDYLNDPTGTTTAGSDGSFSQSPSGWAVGPIQGGVKVAPIKYAASSNPMTEWLNWVRSIIPNSTATDAARQLTMVADRQPIPLIYGEDRVGAMVLNVVPYDFGTGPYIIVQCLWGYACDSMPAEPSYNDVPLQGAFAYYHTFYNGYGAHSVWNIFQTAFQNAAGVPYTDTLAGWAVSYIAIPQNKFLGSLKFEAVLRGRRVYDPRDPTQSAGNSATWKWSDNPALCDADFLVNFCGKTVDYSSVGVSGNYTTLTYAANANDELVASEKRRTLNVTFKGRESAKAVSETLRAYSATFHVPGTNGIRLVPDRPGNSVATYTHASGQIASVRVSKKDSGNFPTESEVVYTNRSSTPWKDDSVFVAVSGVGTTLPRRLTSVSLPGINRYSQAKREAYERLNRMRTSDMLVVMEVFDIGIQHEEGDIITANHPLWNTNKMFRIGAPEQLPNGMWRLSCIEYSLSGYSDDSSVGPTYPDTGFTNPALPPATPTGLARSFGAGGVELSWNANTELTVTSYELRKGASWDAGTPLIGSVPTIVGGTTFVWPAQTAGSYTVWIKAITSVGAVSAAAASLSVTISAPVLAAPSYVLSNDNAIISWSLASTDLPVKFYRVRKAGALIAEVNATSFTTLVDWSGDKVFSVAAVDVGGNEGTAQSVTISISGPSAVQNFHASVVTNSVLFYWDAPAIKPLPIIRYEMRRGAQGATWDASVSIGDKAGDQDFTTYFEGNSGTFTYWIRAVDSAGIASTPSSLTLKVDSPAGFQLQNEWTSTLSSGNRTLTNAVLWDGMIYMPVNSTETFQTHFSGAYSTPQGQMSAGYNLYAEPTVSSGSYSEWFDAGGTINSSFVTFNYTGSFKDQSCTITPKIEVDTVSTFNSANLQTFNGVTQAFAAGFRYIRVTLTISGSDGNDLYELTSVNVKLALKIESESGSKAAGDFTGSPLTCAVTFTKSFVDVSSINVTPLGTARREVAVEFNDVNNPTGFTVRIFDPTNSGAQVSNAFTWVATGVV